MLKDIYYKVKILMISLFKLGRNVTVASVTSRRRLCRTGDAAEATSLDNLVSVLAGVYVIHLHRYVEDDKGSGSRQMGPVVWSELYTTDGNAPHDIFRRCRSDGAL